MEEEAEGHAIDAAPGEHIVRLRLALARLARRQRHAVRTDLTLSQQSALAMIELHGPIALGDLARIEDVSAPTISRIVAKLEAQGLVERTSDPDDRRVARVAMTAVGSCTLAEARALRNEWLAACLSSLPPEDARAVLSAIGPLERLAEAAASRPSTTVPGPGGGGRDDAS